MTELDMSILVGKTVRLFLPSSEHNDIIFKLGDNIIGCVDTDLQRHYNYEQVGTYFEADSFYRKDWMNEIRWVDCGLFTVESFDRKNLFLEDANGRKYSIVYEAPEGWGCAHMREDHNFEISPFKNLV